MNRGAKILLAIAIIIPIAIAGWATANTSPSGIIHEQISEGHENMKAEAVEIMEKLESDELYTETDSIFTRGSSEWQVSALQGERLTMINIIVDDPQINYTLHLTGTKTAGEAVEYVQYSIYEQP